MAVRKSRDTLRGLPDQVCCHAAGGDPASPWAVNLALPQAKVRSLGEIYEKSLAGSSFTMPLMLLLGVAGAVSLLLALIGAYGMIS